MTWLIPVLLARLQFSRYMRRTRRSKICAYICGPNGLHGRMAKLRNYEQWKTQRAVEKYAYSRLESATRNILGLTQQIIFQATDGWLPQPMTSSSRQQTASLVCRYLNVDKRAPVVPDRSWLVWIHQQTKEVQDEFSSVLSSYAPFLDDQLLRAAVDFKQSFMLTFPAKMITVLRDVAPQKGLQYPPHLVMA